MTIGVDSGRRRSLSRCCARLFADPLPFRSAAGMQLVLHGAAVAHVRAVPAEPARAVLLEIRGRGPAAAAALHLPRPAPAGESWFCLRKFACVLLLRPSAVAVLGVSPRIPRERGPLCPHRAAPCERCSAELARSLCLCHSRSFRCCCSDSCFACVVLPRVRVLRRWPLARGFRRQQRRRRDAYAHSTSLSYFVFCAVSPHDHPLSLECRCALDLDASPCGWPARASR